MGFIGWVDFSYFQGLINKHFIIRRKSSIELLLNNFFLLLLCRFNYLIKLLVQINDELTKSFFLYEILDFN